MIIQKPHEKYESKWEIFPKVGVNIKDIWNHHLDDHSKTSWVPWVPSFFFQKIPPTQASMEQRKDVAFPNSGSTAGWASKNP